MVAIILAALLLVAIAVIIFSFIGASKPPNREDEKYTSRQYDADRYYDDDVYRYEERVKTRKGARVAGVVGAVILSLMILPTFITKVDAGEVLVPVQFGEVLEPIETEGVTFISPFANRVRMPVRTVELSFIGEPDDEDKGEDSGLYAIKALSLEGAQVGVDVTVLYHIDPTKAGDVYRTVGTRWEETLVIPRTRNTVRDCIPEYTFELARTAERGAASECILTAMQTALAPRGIVIEDVLLREMRADKQLQAAIDEKLEAQSNAARAQFVQAQAKVEAETIVIEAKAQAEATIAIAQGEATANDLIAASLTEALLTLRIYEQLNDKTVVITDGGTAPLPILPIGGSTTP